MTCTVQVSLPTLRATLVEWEWLRLWYNIVMFAFGWWSSYDLKWHMDQYAILGYWGSVVLYGVTANVFFTLGPAAECYRLAFYNKGFGKSRVLLFALGLIVSWISVVGFDMYLTLLYGAFFAGD